MLASIAVTLMFIGVSHALVGGEGLREQAKLRLAATKLRGIHQGMVTFSQGNRDFYPGMDDKGGLAKKKIEAAKDIYGTKSTSGAEPSYRITVMLRGAYFPPDYPISPFDDQQTKSPAKVGKDITDDHFSFAMLRIDDTSKRVGEWRATNNSKAAVASDRNLGKGAGKDSRAVGKPTAEGWEGAVVYGDNHEEWNARNPLKNTEYGRVGQVSSDDLFAEDKTDKGDTGADAAMVYQDAKTYVNQK